MLHVSDVHGTLLLVKLCLSLLHAAFHTGATNTSVLTSLLLL